MCGTQNPSVHRHSDAGSHGVVHGDCVWCSFFPVLYCSFQTATGDRGKEFACYANLEATHDVQIYFADPYSSWQRGSNENANGLLREFFPKGTDLAQITDEALWKALHLINHRPRKCLGWKTVCHIT
nr:IS30 family transposase [Paenibacillus farraposensis]